MTDAEPPLPTVPEPGDRIRLLLAITGEYDEAGRLLQAWQDARLVEFWGNGIWWVPADDRSGATWTPWHEVVSMEGPEPSHG